MEIPNLIKDNRKFNFSLLDNEVIYNYNLTGNEFLVYCYLLSKCICKSSCFPSYDLACKELNLSRATFSDCIKKLNHCNLITIMHTKTKNGVANIYCLCPVPKNIGSSKIELGYREGSSKIELGVVQKLDCNNIKDNNIKDIYSGFLDFWNSKGIIIHKKLSPKAKTKLKNLLIHNDEKTIKRSIDNYSIIVLDTKYFFNYKWTFEDFLNRGFEKFKIDIDILKNNFLVKNKTNTLFTRLEINEKTKNMNIQEKTDFFKTLKQVEVDKWIII